MRKGCFLLFLSCIPAWPEATSASHLRNALARIPRSFEANQGQAPAGVKYLSQGPGYSVYLSATEIAIASPNAGMLRMKLIGSNRNAKIEPLDPLPGTTSYFIGSDPSKWRTDIPNYARVALRGIYPGIDLILYSNKRKLEYDLLVAPGADPKRIRLKFTGIDRLRKEPNGDVTATAGGVEIRQRQPVIYQMLDGRQQDLAGGYALRAHNQVSFTVARYDTHQPLIIDPTFIYSTYLGGNVYDYGSGIAVDYLGNAYVTGTTASSNFPLAGSYPSSGPALSDVFVAKISPRGALIYSLILSGRAGYDSGFGIAVDVSGSAYVTGRTQGGFPIVNALQPTPGIAPNPTGPNPSNGNSAFVTKINPQGALVYSTYLGGSGNTVGRGIAVDTSGNVTVAGYAGGGFPLLNALEPTFGGGTSDAFVTKINPSGTALIYSTYLGGSGDDGASGVAVDSNGNAYVSGTTTGAFPVASALQAIYGGGASDAFVAKLNPQGSALVYSTYLGGTGDDSGSGIALDGNGNAYVTGSTSGGFPLAAPLQGNYGGGAADVFVTEINAPGSALVYSTYLGGSGSDSGAGIAVDPAGDAYITGETSGPTRFGAGFPVKNAVQSAGGNSAFVAAISAQGASLVYSTYLGGGGSDSGDSAAAIAVDSVGNSYVTGATNSNTFPRVNAFQSGYGTAGGFSNAFVSVISGAPGSVLFGSFDTPVNNTNNIVGAIGITGWALSTFATTKVEIYRDPVGSEVEGKFGVLVGTATFVPGARPDVQARYPTYAANSAGWGYQLLTNFLPNHGNGTFQLHAIAYDSGGNMVEIGAPGKTISCTNATAAKPFGTIDTPGQGATVAGSQYINFGWALTPGASFKIPVDGSTITVMVDGAPLGHPIYNQYRPDIANGFLDYTNSQGAVGFFYLDSTRLTDGLHAISWLVTDDHNRSEGIGSRYFTVANGAENIPAETEPIEPAPLHESNQYFVEADELDRIELHVGASASAEPLPIGSTLKGGVFYWQLGPGFLGDYQLLFTRPGGEKVPVRVLVHPKTYREANQ